MLTRWSHVTALSEKYRINEEDILLIALNSCGLRSDLPYPRMRFRMNMRSRPETQFRFILSLGRSQSPFELQDDQIIFDGRAIADIQALEDDYAVIGYFRKNRRVITFNSNARSRCTGCIFCPNTLEGSSDPHLSVLDDLSSAFGMLELQEGWTDLHHIQEVNLSTGCFQFEDPAVEHLISVRRALSKHNSSAQIGFLTSVVTSRAGLERIAKDVGSFDLILTIECFSNRDLILKQSKAKLTPDRMATVLGTAKSLGIDSRFTYIVGLDPADVTMEHMKDLVGCVTRFPNLQVYQPHNRLMDRFIAPGASHIEYYLDMRLRLEDLFYDTGLRPESWENYRPLWYFTFADEELHCERL